MFRQRSNLASSKLNSKEIEVEARLAELLQLRQSNEDLESKANDMALSSGQGGPVGKDGRPMTKEEFKNYGQTLREKTQTYKVGKDELAKIN